MSDGVPATRPWTDAPGTAADPASARAPLGPADLPGELDRFKAELRAGGLRESTIHAYLQGASLFARWLAGDYVPRPRCAARSPGRTAEVPS